MVDELIGAGWLDVEADGTRDRSRLGRLATTASVAARNAWEAKYMREWRRRKREAKEAEPPLSALSPPVEEKEKRGDKRSGQRVDNALATTDPVALASALASLTPEERAYYDTLRKLS